MNNKKCSRCKALKGKKDFYKNSSKADNLATVCKICSSETVINYRKNNPEKVRETYLKYRKRKIQEERQRDKKQLIKK